MTDATKNAPSSNRSPEYRLAVGALGGLRQDLFRGAFDYRPLQAMRTDGALTRRLPARIRQYAGWAPHAAVLTAAFFTFLVAYADDSGGLDYVLTGLVPAAAVAMTLLRPIAAWWVLVASTPFSGAIGSHWDSGYPWADSVFIAHLAVMTVITLRTRPRTGAWMWVGTALYGIAAEVFLSPGYSTNLPQMLFFSALALLAASLVHIRREAKHEVSVQRTVTEMERGKRTLLEERTNIARELHDVVAHHMSVVAIQAEAAPYRVENPPPELEQAFVTIRENAVAALTELRRVLGVVRAEDYEAPDAPQPTLGDLDRLIANVRETGLDVEKVVTGAVRELPQGVELSAYRIVQEALSNTLRHAPGATARVEVGYVLGGLGLRIVNGPATGLVKPSPGAGHGLTGMRERVTMLDGEMTTAETADGGYEVTVFLPVVSASQPTGGQE
ncbi:histidine kinase [Streptomyces sp. Je 1-332]|uniref:sensor histidine kinase n=1 Tax=Streptomyces sp. Je 1-332 TaxID=3231270 RepID=UPI003457B46A